MATGGPWKFFNSFRLWMADGTFDLDGDTFYCSLHTGLYTPDPTASVFATISGTGAPGYQVTAGAGTYTAGGNQLLKSFTQSGNTVTFSGADVAFPVTSGTLTARYAVLRKLGTANGHVDPLIAYALLDSTNVDVVTAAGNTLTLKFPSGIFTITGG